MSCASVKMIGAMALPCRREIVLQPGCLQAEEFERVDGH
jgi:hypothetical protein